MPLRPAEKERVRRMKRRFLALVASTVALVAMLPAVAHADGVTELRIRGKDLLQTPSISCGSGTASYEAATNTLTLENATIDADGGNGIRFTGSLTIFLVGENQIEADQRGIYGNGVEGETVLLTGDAGASLTIVSGDEGVQVDDSTSPSELEISGVTLDVTSGARSALVLEGLSLEVTGGAKASLVTSSQSSALRTDADVAIADGSSVALEGAGSYGALVGGELAVEDASLTAKSSSTALWAKGNITIEDAIVSASSSGNALRTDKTLAVSGDSAVTAQGGVFGETGVTVSPLAGERVDVWVGASEDEAAHYASSDGALRSPFSSSATLNSYGGLSANSYVRIVRHEHSGAPATCTQLAVCEYCGDAYGTLDLSNHVWGDPVFRWYEGGKVCAVAFPCEMDPSHVRLMDASVSSAAGKAPTCAEAGTTVYTATASFGGSDYAATTETADVAALGHKTELVGARDATALAEGYTGDLVCTVCGTTVKTGEAIARLPMGTEVMYRLYNPYSGEHFYTSSLVEREVLVTVGWTDEGVGWVAPTEGDPVYRLYNPNAGDHHYTMSAHERDVLVEAGWTDEGVGWYSANEKDVTALPVYRQYNPNAATGTHNYTLSKDENDMLVDAGWNAEGIAWYAVEPL